MDIERKENGTIIWPVDQGTGRITGAYTVELENSDGDLVLAFRFTDLKYRQQHSGGIDPDGAVRLASISFYDPLKSSHDKESVLSVARYLGPIFGDPEDAVEPVIRERYSDWLSAASVLAFVFRCRNAALGADHYKSLDNGDGAPTIVAAQKGPSGGLELTSEFILTQGGAYEKYLRRSVRRWKLERKGSALWLSSSEEQPRSNRGFTFVVVLGLFPFNPRLAFGLTVSDIGRRQPVLEDGTEQALSNYLVEQFEGGAGSAKGLSVVHDSLNLFSERIIHLHLASIGHGIVPVRDKGAQYQGLGPVFTSALQQIWYVLALQFTSARTGICIECGRPFAVLRKRSGSNEKKHCSDSCRNKRHKRQISERRPLANAAIKEACCIYDLTDPSDFEAALKYVEKQASEMGKPTASEVKDWRDRLSKRRQKALRKRSSQ